MFFTLNLTVDQITSAINNDEPEFVESAKKSLAEFEATITTLIQQELVPSDEQMVQRLEHLKSSNIHEWILDFYSIYAIEAENVCLSELILNQHPNILELEPYKLFSVFCQYDELFDYARMEALQSLLTEEQKEQLDQLLESVLEDCSIEEELEVKEAIAS